MRKWQRFRLLLFLRALTNRPHVQEHANVVDANTSDAVSEHSTIMRFDSDFVRDRANELRVELSKAREKKTIPMLKGVFQVIPFNKISYDLLLAVIVSIIFAIVCRMWEFASGS